LVSKGEVMKQTILANGRILQTMEPVTVSDGLDIVIEGDKIIDVGKNMAVSYPEAKIIDVGGKMLQRWLEKDGMKSCKDSTH
jgi:predicted amidohydrolase YtcJ